MSVKWTSGQSESGILRKSEFKEKKEELFVFGYSCKLFRDDDKALHIDQGKHLIPWMGDETLKIDRYDARGALHELARHEAPPGGFDWRIELTKTEQDVEQLCDEERYRALHTDEDEEEMYKEEELKRLHAEGYGQVGFNYDTPAEPEPPTPPTEVDEPFIPTPSFKALLPADLVLPESEKQNAIIEKTAKFIASQGMQMEILIKAKQGDNPQFQFLNRDSELHPYYTTLIGLVKAGKWPEKPEVVVEEKPPENDDYLHPSLASTIIESAPSIPSIHYKPSADCDYTMLISKMRGSPPPGAAAAPGDSPPPGTAPLPLVPRRRAVIARPPLMYTHDSTTQPPPQLPPPPEFQNAAYFQQVPPPTLSIPPPKIEPKSGPLRSTGLSLMKNYNTDSDSDVSDCDDTSSTDSKGPSIPQPPEEIQIVIDKMALYVSRNGAEFADIVRAKGDPRFAFLEPSDVYHAYYCSRLGHLRPEQEAKKNNAPVSFSIKKLKEPDPILPKPALPYESSSDEEADSKKEKQPEKDENSVKNTLTNQMPPATIYKMDGVLNHVSTVKTFEPIKPKVLINPLQILEAKISNEDKPILANSNQEKTLKVEDTKKPIEIKKPPEIRKSATPESKIERKPKERDSPKPHKKEKDKYKEKLESRERKRSPDREKKRVEKVKKRKYSRDELETEVISLEDNSDDMIDLTGDYSDTKPEAESDIERQKQLERRRRAAEFLKRVGVDPAAAALPTSSLASAMVDTLESLRKKKAEAEEKRRKREKRRHRDKHGYDDEDKSHRKSKRRKHRSSEEESDYDSSKKKKRKKEKKSSKGKKKKKRESVEGEEEEHVDHPLPPNMDLSTTLKELRTQSPSKELCLQDFDDNHTQSTNRRNSSSSEEETRKKKKKDREYSEGEWSSDSEADSRSSLSRDGD